MFTRGYNPSADVSSVIFQDVLQNRMISWNLWVDWTIRWVIETSAGRDADLIMVPS